MRDSGMVGGRQDGCTMAAAFGSPQRLVRSASLAARNTHTATRCRGMQAVAACAAAAASTETQLETPLVPVMEALEIKGALQGTAAVQSRGACKTNFIGKAIDELLARLRWMRIVQGRTLGYPSRGGARRSAPLRHSHSARRRLRPHRGDCSRRTTKRGRRRRRGDGEEDPLRCLFVSLRQPRSRPLARSVAVSASARTPLCAPATLLEDPNTPQGGPRRLSPQASPQAAPQASPQAAPQAVPPFSGQPTVLLRL